MMCTPESVSTTPLISPTRRAKEASSNGLCIWPRVKNPRSPPLDAEEQSDSVRARSSKDTWGWITEHTGGEEMGSGFRRGGHQYL